MIFQSTGTRIAAAFGLAALMFVAATAVSSSPAGAQPTQTQSGAALPVNGSQLDAQQIYEANVMTTDPDVKTLVITIPDNAGTSGSAWEGFLPSNATVARGTAVVVLNADVNATHTVTMSGAESGQSATDEVPYMNTTAYMLDAPGQYTFTDETARINGTVNVVENATLADDPITNESRSAVGLFIAPASDKSNFEAHLNTLGFNAVSTYNFSGTQNSSIVAGTINASGENSSADNNSSDDMTLFVWTQQVSHPNTIDGRLASKVRTLEDLFYPGNVTKQSNNTLLNN